MLNRDWRKAGKSQTAWKKIMLCIIFAGIIMGGAAGVLADAVLKTGVDGIDCRGCHGKNEVLPEGHAALSGMTYDNCVGCHEDAGVSMREDMLLDHVHMLHGIGCSGCHSDPEEPAAVASETCYECHGDPRAVADLTADVDPNPHDSKHYGTDLDCDLCHRLHMPSVDFCAQCHDPVDVP